MRITSKIFLFLCLWFVSILCNAVSAASPFDILSRYLPDIAVTDIHQETGFIYVRVCNLGWTLIDSENIVVLAIKKLDGWIISVVEPILLDTNNCHEFQVASIEELGITTSGMYNIAAGALLKNGRVEKVKDNNKMIKSVDIIYPSKYIPIIQSPVYYSPNTSNSSYCNSSNNYCSGTIYGNSATYYCIPGTSNCSTVPSSNYNNTYYCNSSNNYCANNNYNTSMTYYRANICPSWDAACNNSYYNSTNIPYQNSNNQYCTYSNNYCNNYQNSNTNYCDSTNNYCNNYNYNQNNSTSYCNYTNNYCNNYNYYNTISYDRPDLVVQRIYQNSSDKSIIAQICNQGGDMNSSASVRTNFVSNNTTASMYNTVQIGRGQCTSSIVYTTPAELGIIYSGNYTVSTTVDANNNTMESNESNNTLSQYLYLETTQNQKSDLVVDRISSNDNNRTIITHVCNIGDNMLDYNNWVMEISNTTNNSVIRNSWQRLSRGQCTDVSTSYASLGIYQSGGYNFRVVIDPDNAISEQSRYNNTLLQYLQLSLNY